MIEVTNITDPDLYVEFPAGPKVPGWVPGATVLVPAMFDGRSSGAEIHVQLKYWAQWVKLDNTITVEEYNAL